MQKFTIKDDPMTLQHTYKPDFICYGEVAVECKARSEFVPENLAQTLNYIRMLKIERGILVNFGRISLDWKRLKYTDTFDYILKYIKSQG